MSGRFFLDTNILVYSYDLAAPDKMKTALDLVEGALGSKQGVVSWQVVEETLHALRRKFASTLSVEHCGVYLDRVLLPLCAVYPNRELYHRALQLHDRNAFAFYHALIVAAAIEAGCDRLFTEAVKDVFRFSGARYLFGKVQAINDFRNARIVHQETTLSDPKEAKAALAQWIEGLLGLWRVSQMAATGA